MFSTSTQYSFEALLETHWPCQKMSHIWWFRPVSVRCKSRNCKHRNQMEIQSESPLKFLIITSIYFTRVAFHVCFDGGTMRHYSIIKAEAFLNIYSTQQQMFNGLQIYVAFRIYRPLKAPHSASHHPPIHSYTNSKGSFLSLHRSACSERKMTLIDVNFARSCCKCNKTFASKKPKL